MEPLTIGILSIVGIIALIMIGFHIATALALVGFTAIYAITGRFDVASSLLYQTAQAGVADYIFAVIPLFILMGLLATQSGAIRDLFVAAAILTGKLRGGLGVATVGSNAVFASVTGVSVASAAIFSKIAIPEMARAGYNRRFALGIVGSSALLGMLIPPSILMIVYGVLSEQSIGRLFAAGIVPGLLVALVLALIIVIRAYRTPGLVGSEGGLTRRQNESRHVALLRVWPLVTLVALVLGGIYGGWFTPTEAAAVGAAGAVMMVLAKRTLGGGAMRAILLDTGRTTAAILLLLVAAQIYSRALTLSGLPGAISAWVLSLGIEPMMVILAFVAVIILLGFFIDSVSILLLTMPIMVPVVASLGFDLIWFGIVAIVAVEVGLLTPPFGMVVFAMKASLSGDLRVEEIFAGVLPFLIPLLGVLALLIALPGLTTFLPDLLF